MYMTSNYHVLIEDTLLETNTHYYFKFIITCDLICNRDTFVKIFVT